MSEAAGTIYARLFDEQLKEEAARKASFDSRGLAVISTSGALVSLLLALAALITKSDSFSLVTTPRDLLITSCVLFVVATVLGLTVNWPREYRQIAMPDLKSLLDEDLWEGSATVATRRISEAQAGILERARTLNRWKSRVLVAAMVSEVAAVVALAIGVVAILGGADK